MTVFSATDGIAVGQPINPNFGAANGAAAAPVIQQPTTAPVAGALQATGVQMSVLEAMSRGILPRNAMISTVYGAAVSAGVSLAQGDSMTVDEALTSGNGTQVNLGVAIPKNAGNGANVTTGTLSPQVFVDGIAENASALATGPVPTNTESIISAPLSGATTTNNVALVASGFGG